MKIKLYDNKPVIYNVTRWWGIIKKHGIIAQFSILYYTERRDQQFPVFDTLEHIGWTLLQWPYAVSCFSLDSGRLRLWGKEFYRIYLNLKSNSACLWMKTAHLSIFTSLQFHCMKFLYKVYCRLQWLSWLQCINLFLFSVLIGHALSWFYVFDRIWNTVNFYHSGAGT